MRLPVPVMLLALPLAAQWLNHPTPGAPRGKDGKVNLAAPAPRTRWGKPDLSGLWHIEPTPLAEMKRVFGNDVDTLDVPGMEADSISKYAVNLFADLKPEDWPVRPEAAAIQRGRKSGENPADRCLPIGLPATMLVSEPRKIIQAPDILAIFHESDGTHRQIHLDGRKLPVDPQPSWLGYSAGRWERDTLVVETNGFNSQSWLDLMGHPRSESLQMTERMRRRDYGHLDVEIAFEDPAMYTRPFTIKVTEKLIPDSDILEFFCTENEKDRAHAR